MELEYRYKSKKELINEIGSDNVNKLSKKYKIVNILDNFFCSSIDSETFKKVNNRDRVFVRYAGNDYLIINEVITEK